MMFFVELSRFLGVVLVCILTLGAGLTAVAVLRVGWLFVPKYGLVMVLISIE